MKPHIARAAEQFHHNNPHVYEKLREIALQVVGRGRAHFGIKFIFERLRWLSAMETTGDLYKINNNHAPWYARKLMAEEPELQGLFVTRDGAHDPDYHQRAEAAAALEEWQPPF